jgi:hypothetical protein
MLAMVPEECLLSARTEPRAQLAEFARWEYAGAEARTVEARIRRELELLPGDRSASQRLRGWMQRRLGREDDRAARQPMAADDGFPDGTLFPIAAAPILASRSRPLSDGAGLSR